MPFSRARAWNSELALATALASSVQPLIVGYEMTDGASKQLWLLEKRQVTTALKKNNLAVLDCSMERPGSNRGDVHVVPAMEDQCWYS